MKRSVNLSRTRQPRDPLLDYALLLQEQGVTKEQIRQALIEFQAAAQKCRATLPETSARLSAAALLVECVG